MSVPSGAFSGTRRLAQAKAREYSIVDQFPHGYQNREDVTNLPPGVLIVGSQNVLTNVSERVQIRQGYALDGDVSAVMGPVLASFDWLTRGNGEVHVRAGGLTSAGNDGKLQYRYVDSAGAVTWRDLMSALTTVRFNFTTYWNTTESVREMLYVNGTANIFKWNGAVATLLIVDNLAGAISVLNATPTAAGLGYVVGDVLTITAGGTNGTATVLTIGGGGAVGTVSLMTPGEGYSTGAGQATSGGTGAGATLNITTVVTGKIKISGTDSVLNNGFYTAAGLNIVINGTTYAYSVLVGSYFVGISPSAAAEAVGSVIHQAPVTTTNASMTGLPSTFLNGLISTLNNQVFVGSLTSPALYISKVNNYIDYSSSTPRQTGEGAVLILDDNCVAFQPQESFMYVSCGHSRWYNINFELQTSTVGVTYEQVNAEALKTGPRQGARSQAYVSHKKNDIIVATFETTIDTLGRVLNIQGTPQQSNRSDPIKLDIDSYDFTDGSIGYWRYFTLLAVPVEGIVRIFNENTQNWEAPQTIPVSRFYIVDGELYGHSYETFESYKLFTGYADRVYTGFEGFPIQGTWVFSYQNYGSRFAYKSASKMYVEGYINANTTLTAYLTADLDGCATEKSFELSGDNGEFVCLVSSSGSVGKDSLGKHKLGGDTGQSIQNLPPKFRWFPTFTNTDFFESSIAFSVLGTDERAEILAFGLAVRGSTQIPVQNYD